MKRKICCVLLTITMIIGMVGCGTKNKIEEAPVNATTEEVVAEEPTEEVVAEEPTEEVSFEGTDEKEEAETVEETPEIAEDVPDPVVEERIANAEEKFDVMRAFGDLLFFQLRTPSTECVFYARTLDNIEHDYCLYDTSDDAEFKGLEAALEDYSAEGSLYATLYIMMDEVINHDKNFETAHVQMGDLWKGTGSEKAFFEKIGFVISNHTKSTAEPNDWMLNAASYLATLSMLNGDKCVLENPEDFTEITYTNGVQSAYKVDLNYDGEVVCYLVFDEKGNLLNIDSDDGFAALDKYYSYIWMEENDEERYEIGAGNRVYPGQEVQNAGIFGMEDMEAIRQELMDQGMWTEENEAAYQEAISEN